MQQDIDGDQVQQVSVAEQERNYRSFGVSAEPLGMHKYLVRSRRTGVTRMMPRFQAELLLSCAAPDTLRRHAERLYQKMLRSTRATDNPSFLKKVRARLMKGALETDDVRLSGKQLDALHRHLSAFYRMAFLSLTMRFGGNCVP